MKDWSKILLMVAFTVMPCAPAVQRTSMDRPGTLAPAGR